MSEESAPLVPVVDEQRRTQSLASRVTRRIRWGVRAAWPSRAVTRDVHGVRMAMPWVHRLPDYVSSASSTYGRNLVDLAELLHSTDAPLHVIDVGANIGDSALPILDAVPDSKVLCVEGDHFYLPFLRRNTVGLPVVVEPSLLVTGRHSTPATVGAVRRGGTTTFTIGGGREAPSFVSVDELRSRHPDFALARLVKSDTDGFDVALVPALARGYIATRPVLFFEYDVRVTRAAGLDPYPVWAALIDLGYTEVALWTNGGRPLTRLPTASMIDAVRELEDREAAERVKGRRQTAYWDVAAVHTDDSQGLAAIRELVPVSSAP